MSKQQATLGAPDTLREIALEALRKYVETLRDPEDASEVAAFVRGYYMGLQEGLESEEAGSCSPIEHLLSIIFGEGVPDLETLSSVNLIASSSKEAA